MDKTDDQDQSDATKKLERVIVEREDSIRSLQESRLVYKIIVGVLVIGVAIMIYGVNLVGESTTLWKERAKNTSARATCAESRLFSVHKDLTALAVPRLEGDTTYASVARLEPMNGRTAAAAITGEIAVWGHGSIDDPTRLSINYKWRHPNTNHTEVYLPLEDVRALLLKSTETIPDECIQLGKNPVEQVDPEEMGWASHYIGRLVSGETVSFRPRGNSMSPRIKSGQLVTLKPTKINEIEVNDIVLCRVQGREYLHLIDAKTARQVRVVNMQGHVNGWTKQVYGKIIRVED